MKGEVGERNFPYTHTHTYLCILECVCVCVCSNMKALCVPQAKRAHVLPRTRIAPIRSIFVVYDN